MFPRNYKNHLMKKRDREVFYVKRAKTERLRKSAVINMQKLLNKDALETRPKVVNSCDSKLRFVNLNN